MQLTFVGTGDLWKQESMSTYYLGLHIHIHITSKNGNKIFNELNSQCTFGHFMPYM